MKRTSKIVITGAAGLVGQNLILHLQRQGYQNIHALDKHPKNTRLLSQLHTNLNILSCDLSIEGAWQDVFDGAQTVFLLHAQIGSNDAQSFEANNVTATQNVLKASQKHNVPYLIHISSSVVESVADDMYTRSKKTQEEMVQQSGLSHIIFRPTLMFGWFDRKHLGWLARFMKKFPVFPIPGNGRFMRQPLYVGDFCQILIRAMQQQTQSEPLNITGLERIDYVDMIRSIKRVTGAKTWIVHIPYGLFHVLLTVWAWFDSDPPFTTEQLKALVAGDAFEVIDWPEMFGVTPTSWEDAIDKTLTHPQYSSVELDF